MVMKLNNKPRKYGPKTQSTAELALGKGGTSTALLSQTPCRVPIQTYRVPERIWQVNANEEDSLALLCTCQQLRSD